MINKYFTDTNVGIAYTYYPDKFHPSVKEKIDNTEKILVWSSFTEYEFKKKYRKINEDIDDFFIEIQKVLINKEVYSYDYFENLVMRNSKDIEIDDYKKIKLLELVWDKLNLITPQSFSRLNNELLSSFNEEKNMFLDKINLFDCGRDNYKNSPEILNKLKREVKVHYPDYIIVIDAHVLSLKDQIIFLTCDEKLYSKISAKNINFLNIQDYELIKEAN